MHQIEQAVRIGMDKTRQVLARLLAA